MLTPVQQIFEQIKKSSHTLIVVPKDRNGDNIASSLALFLYLKNLQKKADLVGENFQTKKHLAFLPSFGEIKSNLDNLQKFTISLDISSTKPEQVKYTTEDNKLKFIITPKNGSYSIDDLKAYPGDHKYGLIITVGAQDLESIGSIYDNNVDFFYKTPLINIDHSTANEEFGQINLINLVSSSNSEILYYLFKDYDQTMIDEEVATCLLAGMILKTKNFKTQSVSPRTLEAAAQLISLGARRDEINNELFRSRSFNALKLWGRALARLSATKDSSLVWSVLSYTDLLKTEADASELNEIIDELIVNIPESKIIALFYEEAPGMNHKTNAIIYSIKSINAGEILGTFHPAITNNDLLHIKSELNLQELSNQVIALLENYLKRINT